MRYLHNPFATITSRGEVIDTQVPSTQVQGIDNTVSAAADHIIRTRRCSAQFIVEG